MRHFIFSLVLMSAPLSHADTLTLLNWEEYLSERVIEHWQISRGKSVKQIYFDNDEQRDAILSSDSVNHIDLVVIDEMAALSFGNAGHLHPITEKSVPNLKYIDPVWQNHCGGYGVPYFWGTIGLAYREDKLTTPPDSWHALMTPEKELHGHIGMLEDFTDTLVPALILQGTDINSQNRKELQKAFSMLKAQLPFVLTYDYAISYIQKPEIGNQLYLALAYSGDQHALNKLSKSENWRFVVPKEGTVRWLDCIAISASSANINTALDFINAINIPEIASMNAEDVWVASPNQAANQLISEELSQDTDTYPPDAILQKSQFYKTLDKANVQLRNRITSSLVKLHDAK